MFETIAIVSTLVFASVFTGLVIMNNRAEKEELPGPAPTNQQARTDKEQARTDPDRTPTPKA